MSADLDARIEGARRALAVREADLERGRRALAALEAEREAMAQAYPGFLETTPDGSEDHVVLGVAVADSPMASVEVVDEYGGTSIAYITPADARRMATWLAAFAEEHGA